MDLKTIIDEFDRVAKKQELSTSKYHQLIVMVEDEIKQALADLQSANDIDHKSVIKHLTEKLDAYRVQEQIKMLKKDLKVDLKNYPEILGEFVETDISKASRNVEFESPIVNKIILNLLYHEGLFDVANTFTNEAQQRHINWLRRDFSKMHEILDALKAKNLEPALNWVSVNRRILDPKESNNLEFNLRRLQFLKLLKETPSEGINFVKTYLSPLASNHRNEVLNLTVFFFWPEKIETSPYSDLMSPEKWAAVSQEFIVQFCGSIGVSFRNPLTVTVDAGALGLPTLLNTANLMGKDEWAAMRKFPVAMELGKEFQFHSAFVCPVCKEQSDEDNPAMMLGMDECHHVLCSQTISALTKRKTRFHTIQCPYCSCVMSVNMCRRLYL
ncbi:unnamed protein product [Lactuca saligna]|uniref:RING-type domain-containing protein n=1 Tax=Lactuca saligna TaxID=75948 RepID=A0AA36E8E4_LACSI|nr:unnamed protein product [Lactuca saligna]